MATVEKPAKRKNRRKWFVIAGIAALVLAGGTYAFISRSSAQQQTGTPQGWLIEKTTTGTIEASVSASGSIAPQEQADLRFIADGVVVEILVRPGDKVKVGQPLARIDPTDAELRLASARADQAQSQARMKDIESRPYPADVRNAEAQLAQAQAQYNQTLSKVTNADISAARARLEQAQSRYNQLRAGPKKNDVADAQTALDRARTALQSDRDRLSANKTNAELALQSAVADLTRAQSNYSTAAQNWNFVRETNADPTNPEVTDPTNANRKVKNTLNDAQRQQYYDAFVSAESALKAAEVAVERAKVEYDAARQAEVTGVQNAEQQVTSAQIAYDKLNESAQQDQIADARASIASAQAELARLVGSGRASDLAAAQASVDSAQINLDKVREGATEYERAQAQADLMRTETAVKQAQRVLDQTVLKAPFAASVAKVDLRIGESVVTKGSVSLVDERSFHVDAPIDELDIAQIKIGQQVHITIDALPGKDLLGTVRNLAPLAVKNERGANTYQVTVDVNDSDPEIKSGMSASVQVVTLRKEGVILLPRRAVQTENGETFVYVPGPVDLAATQSRGFGAGPPPPGARRPVTLGLSNSSSIEVLSGLKSGEEVYVPDVVQTFSPQIN